MGRALGFRRLALSACVATVLTAAAAATPVNQGILDQAVAGGVPGVQAYVGKGQRDWAGASGFASIERRQRMGPSNRIRVASITKMMTYAVIMELVKEGRLRRSDRAVDRLPAGTLAAIPFAEQITVDELLEHRSGLHNFNAEAGNDFFTALYRDPQRGSRVWTAAELLGFARRTTNPPTGRPGEKPSYSSTGYIVLERIAEHVGKRPLPQLYRDYVFRPLGMNMTGVEGAGLGTANIADSYARPDGTPTRVSPFWGRKPVRSDGLIDLSRGLTYMNAWARGAGAVASTASDLAKFMQAVESGRLTVIYDQAGEFARAKARPKASFSWNGGSPGIQASIIYAPARDTTVIVLTNATNVGDGSLDIARRLLDEAGKAAN